MNHKLISEYNEVIAVFMSAMCTHEDHTEYDEDGKAKYLPEGCDKWIIKSWSRPEGFSEEMYKRWGWGDYTMGNWHYDSSWDWLTPVIEKIWEVCTPNSEAHYYWNSTTDIRIFRESIEITFNECVKFIKWYNENYLKIISKKEDSEETIHGLSSTYKNQLKEITETSKNIHTILRNHYTEKRLSKFKSFNDFLEDINRICDGGGTGKLLFIKEIEPKFINANNEHKN